MPITTARDIVKASMRKANVLGKGVDLDAYEASNALDELNNMLSDWDIEGDLIFNETIETFNLTDGVSDYTIGSGGDFDTSRPVNIAAATVKSGGSDYSLEAYTREEYAKITEKNVQSIPRYYFYDDNFPLATLRLYYTPTNTDSITLYTDKPMTEFASLNTAYEMPKYYRSALIYNLVPRIMMEYGKSPDAVIINLARTLKDNIKSHLGKNNSEISTIDVPESSNFYGTDKQAFESGV